MSDEEETEYDIPEWSPAFLGWYYEITTYDDGTAAIEQLPDFISIEFDGDFLSISVPDPWKSSMYKIVCVNVFMSTICL